MYLRKLTHIEICLCYTGAFLSCAQDVGLRRDITLLADSQRLFEEAEGETVGQRAQSYPSKDRKKGLSSTEASMGI